MTRGRRLVNTDLLESAKVVSVQQIIEALQSLWTAVSTKTTVLPCCSPTSNVKATSSSFLSGLRMMLPRTRGVSGRRYYIWEAAVRELPRSTAQGRHLGDLQHPPIQVLTSQRALVESDKGSLGICVRVSCRSQHHS